MILLAKRQLAYKTTISIDNQDTTFCTSNKSLKITPTVFESLEFQNKQELLGRFSVSLLWLYKSNVIMNELLENQPP